MDGSCHECRILPGFCDCKKPDVILMDINLPDKSGIDLCKEVKEKFPAIFIFGLSTFNQQSFIQKMMANGASGYVIENATQKELMEAIDTVVKGKLYLSFDAASAIRKPDSTNKNRLLPAGKRSVGS